MNSPGIGVALGIIMLALMDPNSNLTHFIQNWIH